MALSSREQRGLTGFAEKGWEITTWGLAYVSAIISQEGTREKQSSKLGLGVIGEAGFANARQKEITEPQPSCLCTVLTGRRGR